MSTIDSLSKLHALTAQQRRDFKKKSHFEYHQLGESVKDVAQKAFFEQANLYKWKGTLAEYTIWAYKETGEMCDAEHLWPHAHVFNESQAINAGMWFPTENGEFKLIAAWTYSDLGDETSVFYLAGYETDVWALAISCDEIPCCPNQTDQICPITSKASIEHFRVSSGDYVTDKFDCYSLDIITADEMATFEAAYGNDTV